MRYTWHLEYWPKTKDIERWFDKLNKEKSASVAKELGLLRTFGNTLKLPHSKALGKKLFELRERKYGFRIYYTFHGKQVIVLLAAGNKSTQKKDLKLARERLDMLLKQGT